MILRQMLWSLCALFISACQPASTQFLNTNITGSALKTQVPLTTSDSQTLQLNAPNPKQITAVFFGFTMCPDVCPTTLGNLKLVKQQLAKDADQLRVILVSLDPERDTPEILKQYTQAFGGDFIGAATDLTHTPILAKDLGITYEKIGSEKYYMVKHTGNLYLIDRGGRFRVSIPYGADVKSITYDVKQLINEKH